jgi:hypothetical protein
MNANGYVYETFGISKHLSVKPLQSLLSVMPLKLALSAKCFIYRVVRWPLLFSNLFVSFLTHCLSVRVLERDGLEGSFGIFGLRASLAGMPNVPESEGMVCVLALLIRP